MLASTMLYTPVVSRAETLENLVGVDTCVNLTNPQYEGIFVHTDMQSTKLLVPYDCNLVRKGTGQLES